MIPAPYIYVVGLAIGVLIGIGLDAWLGWPWWLVALGFLVLVWLAFLSSAFFGPGQRPPLLEELLDAVHPGTRSERMRQRHVRMIRSCPIPLYGLDPSWTGPRFIGRSSDDGRTIAALQLGFGDHFSKGRWLRIETSTIEEGSLFDLRHWAIELWRRAGRPPPDLPPHQWSAWVKRRIDQHLARGANWSTITIPVDGAPVRFDWLADGADWVARATIAGVIVTIEGHLFPVGSVQLERVTDVEPYIEGSRRWEDERRRYEE